jgi:pilus assembly protein CpaB
VSRRRRAVLLVALALVFGGLAAAEVSRREAALAEQVGPLVEVVVARTGVPAGARLTAEGLAVRRIPQRFAPPDAFAQPAELAGLRTRVALAPGTPILATVLGDPAGDSPAGAPVRPGERVAEVIAAAPPDLIRPGGRVDVLVTREPRPGAAGGTELALEDVEVLAATAAGDGGGEGGAVAGTPQVRASLRVTVRQAVYLAAAQAFARELRLLPRAAGDDRRGAAGLTVSAGL